jgi:ATP-dependent Clp protease ATP-binding subunit ClpX
MGFNAEISSKKDSGVGEILKNVLPEDLIRYGLIPEFVGRLPVLVSLGELDKEALVSILTEPKNALIKQYQKLFSLENVDLEIEKEALLKIAEKTLLRNTGARGLRAILEEIMMEIMYEIPSRKDIKKVIITEDVIENNGEPIVVLKEKTRKNAETA